MVGFCALVVAILSVGYSGRANADELPDDALTGREILAIVYDRANIFDTSDPSTASWPYRWANALHITTREKFIRSIILFSEGDTWDPAIAAESARILRSLGFLNPVYIDARPEGDGVIVTVRTHDRWTLQVGAKFGIEGSRKAYAIEFDEKNFLGWGRRTTVEYQKDHERSTWTFVYADPALFGSRWRGRLLYANASDGQREEVSAERPFFALATTTAWGGQWKHWRQTEYLYGDSEVVAGGHRDFNLLHLWWGTRLPSSKRFIRRLTVGYHGDEQVFNDWQWESFPGQFPTPEDHTISGPRVTFEQIEDRFKVLKGFRGWSTQEDVGLGSNIKGGLTFSAPALGGDIPRIVFDGTWLYRKQFNRWLVLSDIWTVGRIDDGSAANVISGFQLAATQLGKSGWQARFRIEDSIDLDREIQLTLGADTGLRGWNPDSFDGTGRAVLNLQWRVLLKEDFLKLFSVGAVVFADAGKTWGPRYGPGTDGIRYDAGVGLLADMTNIGVSNLLRLDIAMPDDRSGVTIILSSTALF